MLQPFMVVLHLPATLIDDLRGGVALNNRPIISRDRFTRRRNVLIHFCDRLQRIRSQETFPGDLRGPAILVVAALDRRLQTVVEVLDIRNVLHDLVAAALRRCAALLVLINLARQSADAIDNLAIELDRLGALRRGAWARDARLRM